MKKTLLAALLGAALAAPFAAQAGDSYVGVNLGRTTYKDFTDYGSQTATAVSLTYGFALQPGLDVEFGYIHHGEASKTIGVGPDRTSGKARADSLYAAGVGKYALTDAFGIHGKLGLAVTRGEIEESSATERFSGSDTRLNPMFGLGVSYQFTKEFSAVVDYTYFPKPTEGSQKLQMWTVGARYHF